MIKFEGTLSDNCVVYRVKCADRVVIIGSVIGLAICLLGVAIFAILGYDVKELLIWGGILTVAILVLIFMYFNKKPRSRFNVSIELTVNTDFIEYTVSSEKKETIPTNSIKKFTEKKETIPMNKIKKVVKIDQRYYILRERGGIPTSLMAEASFIKEGTIEEFESLFNGKIEIREEKSKK